jgi:hypothetical protein
VLEDDQNNEPSNDLIGIIAPRSKRLLPASLSSVTGR